MNNDRLWELISLKLAGEAQPSELTELESYLQDHPEESLKAETLINLWNARHHSVIRKKEAFNRHLQRLSNHLSEPVLKYENTEWEDEEVPDDKIRHRWYKPRNIIWAGGVAASLIAILFLLPILKGEKNEVRSNALHTVSTKRGAKSKVQLPDGTQVWLNADSRIIYNEDFSGNTREVNLTGEAYFDVVRDENRPFIIHTSAIDLKVLGTAFNVRSYAEEMNTETSLIRGLVEITLVKSEDHKKIILKPNEKLIVNNIDATVIKNNHDKRSQIPIMTLGKVSYKNTNSGAVETLWIENKLAFDDEPLEDIALKVERWYDVKVSITDEKLKKESYTATFEDKTLQEVMEALRAGGGFQYVIRNNEVTIRP
jgi:ferric-dicitrate binding protein FerR (iron transport regulator)